MCFVCVCSVCVLEIEGVLFCIHFVLKVQLKPVERRLVGFRPVMLYLSQFYSYMLRQDKEDNLYSLQAFCMDFGQLLTYVIVQCKLN